MYENCKMYRGQSTRNTTENSNVVITTTTTTTYLLQLSCPSLAVVLTLVQTEQIRRNIHK